MVGSFCRPAAVCDVAGWRASSREPTRVIVAITSDSSRTALVMKSVHTRNIYNPLNQPKRDRSHTLSESYPNASCCCELLLLCPEVARPGPGPGARLCSAVRRLHPLIFFLFPTSMYNTEISVYYSQYKPTYYQVLPTDLLLRIFTLYSSSKNTKNTKKEGLPKYCSARLRITALLYCCCAVQRDREHDFPAPPHVGGRCAWWAHQLLLYIQYTKYYNT